MPVKQAHCECEQYEVWRGSTKERFYYQILGALDTNIYTNSLNSSREDDNPVCRSITSGGVRDNSAM